MNTKPFLTIDKQIELLEQRGLLFQNKEAAKKDLLSYGYYEIINGYKDCFLANPLDSEDKFKAGITFEHIFQLFTLDRKIRSEVMSAEDVLVNSCLSFRCPSVLIKVPEILTYHSFVSLS